MTEEEIKKKVRGLWNWIASNMVDPNNDKSILDAQKFYPEFVEEMTKLLTIPERKDV